MSLVFTIEQVGNGYIVTDRHLSKRVYAKLDDIFDDLLMHFEGRASTFSGDLYGKVHIERGKHGCVIDETKPGQITVCKP